MTAVKYDDYSEVVDLLSMKRRLNLKAFTAAFDASGLTMVELAAVSKVDRVTVWRWRARGSPPSAENLCAVAGALGVSPLSLLDTHTSRRGSR